MEWVWCSPPVGSGSGWCCCQLVALVGCLVIWMETGAFCMVDGPGMESYRYLWSAELNSIYIVCL